jgi:hypothetical protein
MEIGDVAGVVGVVEVERHRLCIRETPEGCEVSHEADVRHAGHARRFFLLERRLPGKRDAARDVEKEDRAVHRAQHLEADIRPTGYVDGLRPPLERQRAAAEQVACGIVGIELLDEGVDVVEDAGGEGHRERATAPDQHAGDARRVHPFGLVRPRMEPHLPEEAGRVERRLRAAEQERHAARRQRLADQDAVAGVSVERRRHAEEGAERAEEPALGAQLGAAARMLAA